MEGVKITINGKPVKARVLSRAEAAKDDQARDGFTAIAAFATSPLGQVCLAGLGALVRHALVKR